MRFVKTPKVATGIMSEKISFKREDSGCPESPISLETHQIKKKYKTLKQEMEPNIIIDYLVQYEILDTDENTFLSNIKERSKKCDFILRRLIRDSSCLLKLTKILQSEPNDLDGFLCFRSLSCETAPEPQNPYSDEQAKQLKVLSHNLKCDESRKKLLDEFKKHMKNESSNNILDDFLQEDLITVDKHEEISSLTNKADAAEMLLTSVSSVSPENPGPLRLLSILKSYGVGDLADRLLQPQVDELKENTERGIPVQVTFLDGKLFVCADVGERKLESVEVKINGNFVEESVFTYIKNAIPESEVKLLKKTHCSIEKASEGSIIILLQTEASDAVEKLRQFIENGDISMFLKQLFETEAVRNVLTKNEYTIEIQIKEVHSTTTGFPANALQRTENSKITYKSILERCHGFLMEELEPSYLLRDDEIASLFTPVRGAIKERTNRALKNELLLEHLEGQSEETIQFVLKKLEEKNAYIYEQLFPKTEKYKDLDIEQVKKNILDNLPKLLEQMSIDAIQTPFLSTGVISLDELKLLRSNCTSSRTENLQFVKLVFQRGEEAIRIFLGALENSCGETEVLQQLKKTETENTRKSEMRNTKIKYEAFDEENGLLFTGNFLLELMKDKDENPDKEYLDVREDQMYPDTVPQYGSQSEDSTSSSSDSDSHAVMPKEVPKKGSQIEKLECDISNVLSKLTRELRKVEKVKDIKQILSARHTSKTLQMEEVRRIYPNKFDVIEEDVTRLQRCLHELQYLSGRTREEIPSQERDDVDPQLDQESKMEVSPKSALYITRQVSVLSFESTDEGTMESDDEEQESQNVLNIKSSKYQSILLVKLHRLETVQSVMKVFRRKEDRDKQLAAVKSILNEEEYIKLEKYIIKLQLVSEKILKTPTGVCA